MDLMPIIDSLKDNFDKQSKEMIKDNEDTIKDFGKQRLKSLLESKLKNDKSSFDFELYMHLIESISDEDILNLKSKNIDTMQEQIEMNKKLKKMSDDYWNKLSNASADILLTAIIAAI